MKKVLEPTSTKESTTADVSSVRHHSGFFVPFKNSVVKPIRVCVIYMLFTGWEVGMEKSVSEV